MDDKKLTQSRLQDLAGQREKYQTVVFTKFLSEQQQPLAACHQNVCFWGGWPDAARKCAAFYPDYLTPEEIQWPVSVIKISPTDGAPLTHRDYLGSLLALGLKREVLGDLLVAPENALLFHLENITEYLAQNLKTVSRSSVKVSCLSVSEVVVPARCFETLTGSVASLRLDNVVGVAVKKSRALAQELYGSQEAMIRLDMTEYMEKQSVARLIGAPPGYVGHEEGGVLTEKVRRRPYSLILLDELEKAHPDVTGILLQVMEDGILTDSLGRQVSFKNTLVVMTSNLGGGKREGEGLGFLPGSRDDRVQDCLRDHFTPEFLGRIDKVVVFHALNRASLEQIASGQLAQLQARAEKNGLHLQFAPELAGMLAGLCGSSGARQIRHNLQNQIENPLSQYLLLNPPGNRIVKIQWDFTKNQPEFSQERR